MEAELKDAKQAADQAKAEAAEGETQIVRLKEEVALERQALQSQLERLEAGCRSSESGGGRT